MADTTGTLSRQQMEAILKDEVIGYLGLAQNEQPYVVPLNYAYLDGKILFHCALEGKKLDYLRPNPQVCFTVGRQDGVIRRHSDTDLCHPDTDSVICYGLARIITDVTERHQLLNLFNRYFDDRASEISLAAAEKCGMVEISVHKMTGRRERDHKCIFGQYIFGA